MIALVEGGDGGKTPNEIAVSLLLSSLSLIFLLVVVSLPAFGFYLERTTGQPGAILLSPPVLISLLVCLIPTTIGGLLSAVGISGMDRLLRHNVVAMSGRAIEAAGNVDVLLLDKTGTITIGNRMAAEFVRRPAFHRRAARRRPSSPPLRMRLPRAGRSSVCQAAVRDPRAGRSPQKHANFIPFSARTKMSGVDIVTPDGGGERTIRKGA